MLLKCRVDYLLIYELVGSWRETFFCIFLSDAQSEHSQSSHFEFCHVFQFCFFRISPTNRRLDFQSCRSSLSVNRKGLSSRTFLVRILSSVIILQGFGTTFGIPCRAFGTGAAREYCRAERARLPLGVVRENNRDRPAAPTAQKAAGLYTQPLV